MKTRKRHSLLGLFALAFGPLLSAHPITPEVRAEIARLLGTSASESVASRSQGTGGGVPEPITLARAALTAAPAGNGALMATSFAPFKPKVRYYWDGAYFYTESDGIPDRTRMPNLMVGITSWQQQVPLPTSYFGGTTNGTNDTVSLGYGQPNIWKIPLVPVPAAAPIPISAGNFQRGAIALAADGVPIFNPANNTGRISYEIGELDTYGGHCGLGDDYHYHIAPVHLTSVLGNDKPIAWSLDGYPMFGYVESDGSAMQPLDADGGHTVGAVGYHYHARGTFNAATGKWTPGAPYMNAAFHGTVVNYGGQVDPQPTASGLRASGTGGYTAVPVAGAAITAFKNPVALTTDGSGNLVENVAGTPSEDQFLMRYTVAGTSYDLCWRLNRNVVLRTLTMTWRLPTIAPTTLTYANSGNRITAYPMAASSMLGLPDTGQTLDATPTPGEDSDYTLNPPSYTDNGNGTITDNVTGLMWQKVDNGESTWETALANAATLPTGGYTDWRLPTPTEALSILNHNTNPALNPVYFVNNASGTPAYWWTMETYGTSTTNVWCTNSGGGLGPKPKSETISAGGAFRYHARYVRGARPSNGHNYVNNLDGTVTDLDTHLMWAQVPSSALTWTGALAYAEALTLGGYSDWRLPNVKELQTLVDLTRATATGTTTAPCLNRILFPAATATAHWTSTSVKSASLTSAWLVEFGVNANVPAASGPSRGFQGIVSYETYASTYPAFAVRTAATPASTQIVVEQPVGSPLIDGVSLVNFGTATVGSSTLLTFTVRNNGTTALTVTGATIDGANAADFTLTAPPTGTLAAGGSTTFVVNFTPATGGSRAASLHLTSSDSTVGAAFDLGLQGVGGTAAPTINAVALSPAVPTGLEDVWVNATVRAATGATLSQVQVSYNGSATPTTTTVFAETMAATEVTPWTGAGTLTPWTVTNLGPANTFSQAIAANHGTGNACGLVFDKGTTNLTDSMVTTTNAITTVGTSGYVEFWLATTDLVTPDGWTFQTSPDGGTTWITRLSELTGVSHAYQLYHYDLTAAEQVAGLKLRFQFAGHNAVAPARPPKANLDDIRVVVTSGSPAVVVPMLDDGLHHDGVAGDGRYGGKIPGASVGTTVTYAVSAADHNGGATTGSTLSYTVTPAAPILTVTPATGLSSTGATGGAFAPASLTYTLTNTGTGVMEWTAGKTASWLTLSATGGSLGSGASSDVMVSINTSATSLAVGSYSDTVTMANATNGVGNTTRNVALTVAVPAPVITTPPQSQAAAIGTEVILRVTASGAQPTYQWRKDGNPISGATNATYSIPSVSAADAGSYTVVASNSGGSTPSVAALLTVLPIGTGAVQSVVGAGYFPGGSVTISNRLTYSGTLSSLRWSVLVPAGWSYASGGGDAAAANVKPAAGAVSLAEWEWSAVPSGAVNFTYTLKVPVTESGDRTLVTVAVPQGLAGSAGALQLLAKPDPLVVVQVTHHDADIDRNGQFNLTELTRVIQLYNTRNGTVRTGCYKVDATGEDGFNPDPTRTTTDPLSQTRLHSADTDRDGRLGLTELTRVIELYNTRAGSVRTGSYRIKAGTEDNFEPATTAAVIPVSTMAVP